MDQRRSNPYESPTSSDGADIDERNKPIALWRIYLNAIGLACSATIYILLATARGEEHTFRSLPASIQLASILLFVIACGWLLVGWAVAAVQIVWGLIWLSWSNRQWIHQLAAALASVACYVVWVVCLQNGLIITV